MNKRTSVSLVAVAATALTLGGNVLAHADPQAQSGDVVGVGSDTVQYGADFLADGDPSGDAGFNAGAQNRVMTYDATATASGLATSGATVVLRAGSNAVTVRPDGSGTGIAALLADNGSTRQIDFVRASRAPKSTENSAADNITADGGLHTYKIATDGLAVATASTTNAPATISTADVLKIYTCAITTWNQITGNSGGSTAVIKPQLPQTGSGTYGQFNTDLTNANGGTQPVYGSCVNQGVQESDYTTLANDPNKIAPFSTGRVQLLNSGYLGSAATGSVKTVSGTGSYLDTRNLYIIVRQKDLASTTPFEPGAAANFVSTLFAPNGFFSDPNNAGNYSAAGLTQAYKDCGKDVTTC